MELNKKRRLNENNSGNNEFQNETKNYCIKKNDNQFIVNNIMIGNKSIVEYFIEFQSKIDSYFIKNNELEKEIIYLKKIIQGLKTPEPDNKNMEIEEIEENFFKYYIS